MEDITKGLQIRREVLEREVVHTDRIGLRIGLHRQSIEREWGRCAISFLYWHGSLTGGILADDRRRDFLAVLPYEDCQSKHRDCLHVLPPDHNAGEWLINREELLDWVDRSPGLLWIHDKREFFLFVSDHYTYGDGESLKLVFSRGLP